MSLNYHLNKTKQDLNEYLKNTLNKPSYKGHSAVKKLGYGNEIANKDYYKNICIRILNFTYAQYI